MLAEIMLVTSVRRDAELVAPGDKPALDAAVRTALEAYTNGASLSEAFRAARDLLISRPRRASHGAGVEGRAWRAAS